LEASVAVKGAAAAYRHACFLGAGDENGMVMIDLLLLLKRLRLDAALKSLVVEWRSFVILCHWGFSTVQYMVGSDVFEIRDQNCHKLLKLTRNGLWSNLSGSKPHRF
jgi:hypothetical protein